MVIGLVVNLIRKPKRVGQKLTKKPKTVMHLIQRLCLTLTYNIIISHNTRLPTLTHTTLEPMRSGSIGKKLSSMNVRVLCRLALPKATFGKQALNILIILSIFAMQLPIIRTKNSLLTFLIMVQLLILILTRWLKYRAGLVPMVFSRWQQEMLVNLNAE